MGIDPSGERLGLAGTIVVTGLSISLIGATVFTYGQVSGNATASSVGNTTFFYGLAVAVSPLAALAAGGSALAPLGIITGATLLYGWRMMVIVGGSGVAAAAANVSIQGGMRHAFTIHQATNAVINPSGQSLGRNIPQAGMIVARGLPRFTDLSLASTISTFKYNRLQRQPGDFVYQYYIRNSTTGDVDVVVYEIQANMQASIVHTGTLSLGGVFVGANVTQIPASSIIPEAFMQ